METATAIEGAPPEAVSSRPRAPLLPWVVSVAILPSTVGFAAALRDGPGDLIVALVVAAGATALGALAGAYRGAARSALAAGLIASATLAGSFLAQRAALPLDVALLALPVAAAAAATTAARLGGGLGVAILALAPLPVVIALVATGQLTPWALFAILAVPDALNTASAALREQAAGPAAAKAQLRFSAYIALALLLAEPRY